MKEKENLLKNTSLNVINSWIRKESDINKKEFFRCLKSDKMKFSNHKMGEVIKVIKEDLCGFEGYKEFSQATTKLIEINSIKLERSYAEFDERYRQIVCNAVVETIDNSGKRLIGFLQRVKGYTEKSLIGTIGMVGGHLNEADHTLYSGLIREVSEELNGISFEVAQICPKGYIREVSDSVSNYHICILYSIKIPYSEWSKVKSKEMNEKLLWMSEDRIREELKKHPDESIFDSWCKEFLENII
jgi:Predicted phosphoesterase (MutT family)